MSARDFRAATRRPLHPPLVHTPVGAVVITAVLDVLSAINGGDDAWARRFFLAGGYASMIGTTVLVLAIIAGVIDRARGSGSGDSNRGRINQHAAVMTLVGVLLVVELVLRRQRYATAASTPALIVVLSVLILALVIIGGELGGRLVYRRHVGVAPSIDRRREPDNGNPNRSPIDVV